MSCGDICLALMAIIFPPIAVWIKRGLCSLDAVLNLCLCLLGYLPGLIHAWYIIARYPDDDEEGEYQRIPDVEAGRVTYYYVSHEPMQPPPPSSAPQQGTPPSQQQQQQQQQQQGLPPRQGQGHQRTPTSGGLPPQQAAPATSQQSLNTGGPDGGQAHRELQRGTSIGSMRQGEGSGRPPPTYAEALADNKVQR